MQKITLPFILAATLLMLSGCGYFDRKVAGVTGGGYSTCEGGVSYLQFTSGASVAYNKNGTVKNC